MENKEVCLQNVLVDHLCFCHAFASVCLPCGHLLGMELPIGYWL